MSWLLPIRLVLPLLLLLISLPLAWVAYVLTLQDSAQTLERELQYRAAHNGNVLSAIIENDMRLGRLDAVKRDMQSFITLHGLKWLLLLDAENRTLHLSEGSLRGQEARLMGDAKLQAMVRQARRTLAGQTGFSSDRATYWGTFPVRIREPGQTGGVSGANTGVLVLSLDAEGLRAEASRAVRMLALRSTAILLLLAFLLWLYLQKNVVSRLESLLLVAKDALPEGKRGRLLQQQDEIAFVARELHGLNQSLRERTQMFESLAELAPVGIFRANALGEYIYVNQRWCEISGMGAEQAAGQGWTQTVHPQDRARMLALWQACVQEQRACKLEYRFLHPGDGTVRHVLAQSKAEYGGDGSVSGYIGTFTDITELKQAEARIRQSQASTRAILDSVNDAIFVHDAATGAILEVNRRMCEMYGYAYEEVPALTIGDLSLGRPPYTQDEALRRLRLAAAGVAQNFEWHCKDKSGRLFWGEISMRRADITGVERVLASVRDISERKALQTALQRKTALYAALNRTNEAIVRATSAQELHRDICRTAVEAGGLLGAWIGVPDEASGTVRVLASHGMPQGYLEQLHISLDVSQPAGQGPTGMALHTGEAQVRNDFLAASGNLPWRAAAERAGIRASACYPLFQAGKVCGALNLYAAEPDFFSQDILDLLKEMAMDISFALDNFAREESRKAAETALAENEVRLRLALSASRQGLFDLDVASGSMEVNAEYARMLGDDPNRLQESLSSFLARLADEDRPRVSEVYDAYFGGMRSEHQLEFRMRTAGGEWKWIQSVGAVAERDSAGRPAHIVGTHTDITARKAAEEQMRLSARVFEHSQEMIIVADADAHIISVNPAFTRITGYSREEVLGRNPNLLHSGRQDKTFYTRLWEAVHEYGYWQGELWNRRKNGEVFPVWETISAVRDEHGSVLNYLSIASDITEFKEAEQRIRHLAYYDALTGLPNRTMLRDHAEQMLILAARQNRELGMMYIDLDRFKTINDSLGHLAGDRLLQGVAKRLREGVRATDVVGRLGGDEFLILLDEGGAAGMTQVAQKLLTTLSAPYEIDGHALAITPSIGITVFPRDGGTFDELLKNADVALYKAKEAGRNGYQFFAPEMNQAAFEHLLIENAMRQGLQRNEFILHYQPQFNLQDGRVVGVEALVRWQHPDMGMVSPAKFIPIAEESNLIVPLGEWVMREACRQNKAWQEAGLPPMVMAVNLSGKQFSLSSVFDMVDHALQASGLDARWLEVEITESMLMQQVDATLEVLGRLRRRGMRISVDDFGTGYSSLSYLKRFPITKLKIDQSFVRELHVDENDRAISAAVVNLAHGLGLQVIAEGVESAEHLEILRGLGCDEGQGYYFSRPLPASALQAFLQERSPA